MCGRPCAWTGGAPSSLLTTATRISITYIIKQGFVCEGLGRWRACFRAPPRRKRRRSRRRWPPHASAPWLAHTQRQCCAEIFLAHGTWQYKVRARRPFIPFLRRRSHGRLPGQHNRAGYPNARRTRRHTEPRSPATMGLPRPGRGDYSGPDFLRTVLPSVRIAARARTLRRSGLLRSAVRK